MVFSIQISIHWIQWIIAWFYGNFVDRIESIEWKLIEVEIVGRLNIDSPELMMHKIDSETFLGKKRLTLLMVNMLASKRRYHAHNVMYSENPICASVSLIFRLYFLD